MLEPLINRPYSEIYVWPRPLPCVAQASTDEDGRLRTVYPSIRQMWTMDRNLGSDRPSHGQIRTLDQDYHLKVDEWTVFLPWTVHLMDEFGRWTKKIILRWTIGRIFDSMDGFGRRTINISTKWMMVDEWTGRRMKQTDG